MKNLILLALLASVPAMAQNQKYVFKTMECMGQIHSQPKGMSDSYKHIGLRLISFKSKRKDGTYANSLGWNTFYGSTHGELVTEMLEKKFGGEVWYTGLLDVRVHRGAFVVFGDDFMAQIIKGSNQHRDYLKGRYGRPGSVVGSYYYDLNCRAYK